MRYYCSKECQGQSVLLLFVAAELMFSVCFCIGLCLNVCVKAKLGWVLVSVEGLKCVCGGAMVDVRAGMHGC